MQGKNFLAVSSFYCPNCHDNIELADDFADSSIQCPHCKLEVGVPDRDPDAEPTLDDLLDLGDKQSKSVAASSSRQPAAHEPLELDKDDYIAETEDDDDEVADLPDDSFANLTVEDLDLPDTQPANDDRQSEKPTDELFGDDLPADGSSGMAAINPIDNSATTEDVQLIDDDDLTDLNDIVDVSENFAAKKEKSLKELSATDPFEHDEFSPLSIAGITQADNVVSETCPICGSMVYAKPSEVGRSKKCPDCYSMVEIKSSERLDLMEPSEKQIKDNTKLGFEDNAKQSDRDATTADGASQSDGGHSADSDSDNNVPGSDEDIYSLAPLEDRVTVDTRIEVEDVDPLEEVAELERRQKESAAQQIERPNYDLPGFNQPEQIPSFTDDGTQEEAIMVAPVDDEPEDSAQALLVEPEETAPASPAVSAIPVSPALPATPSSPAGKDPGESVMDDLSADIFGISDNDIPSEPDPPASQVADDPKVPPQGSTKPTDKTESEVDSEDDDDDFFDVSPIASESEDESLKQLEDDIFGTSQESGESPEDDLQTDAEMRAAGSIVGSVPDSIQTT